MTPIRQIISTQKLRAMIGGGTQEKEPPSSPCSAKHFLTGGWIRLYEKSLPMDCQPGSLRADRDFRIMKHTRDSMARHFNAAKQNTKDMPPKSA